MLKQNNSNYTLLTIWACLQLKPYWNKFPEGLHLYSLGIIRFEIILCGLYLNMDGQGGVYLNIKTCFTSEICSLWILNIEANGSWKEAGIWLMEQLLLWHFTIEKFLPLFLLKVLPFVANVFSGEPSLLTWWNITAWINYINLLHLKTKSGLWGVI